MPITPGSTGVPSIRWSARNGCRGVEHGLDGEPGLHAHPHDGPDHRTGAARHGLQPLGIEPAGRVELVEQDAEAIRDDDLAARPARGQLAPDDRDAGRRRQHVDAGRSIIVGIEPRDAMPMPAHAVQSMAMRARRRARRAELRGPLAEQIVGRAVVGLAAVAEAAGDRAEGDDGAERQVADGVQQVEPAVALHVEDAIELGGRLLRQEVAHLDARRVQQDVDAAVAPPISSITAATAAASVRSTA